VSDDLGTPYLRLERSGPLAWCTIDRREARNALTASMYHGIRRAVDLVNRDPDLAALVITGTNDVFAPGGEMSGRHDDDPLGLGASFGFDMLPFRSIRQSRAPVVAAVNGLCQGGGLIIAMLSDLAVASERATFRAPELLRGVADANLAAILPAHVGVAHARDLLLTARRIDAHEAERIGLIARVVAHDRLEEEAQRAARDLLLVASEARVQCKRLINERYGAVDEMTFQASVASAEAVEGFRAFTEHRAPNWVPEPYRTGERL
jgi:enoyl-CoA hydratase/carnithine racemase